MRLLFVISFAASLFSAAGFAGNTSQDSKNTFVLSKGKNGESVNGQKDPPAMKSSLEEFFKKWPDFQQFTPRSAQEAFGGARAVESRSDMFMTRKPSSESNFFSVSELRFESSKDATRAFETYVSESDPVRGHAMGWEVVIPKNDRIFYMRTAREFSQRTKLLDDFVKAIDAPSALKFICVDTYGCKLQP
jgi:hypothetical protein